MNLVSQIIKEHINNIRLIFLMAKYNTKSKYQMHYLGAFWQFLLPIIQIGIYWFVFGIGIRGGAPVGEVPYFIWLLTGLVPWMFIGPTITQAANSVYAKISLVSKMKFPVSILPTITIVGNSINFIVMLIILQLLLLLNGLYPTDQLWQIAYYLVATGVFMFSVSLLFSTLSTIVRDFQNMIQSFIRMLFFLTPILWDPSRLPEHFHNILKLNPIYYLVVGYRKTFLGQGWFFQDLTYTFYFWSLTLFILFIGSMMHMKFRDKFIDYI
ncbi:ABC transporter permease [Lederbergia citrea]|uniref:Transport permease protein n=1 Tax=Lederbergia citrea TaxID=2833581 RepID=A0A942Z476_9BACI|nr:ABC transporter permease [Lederbergia citrea]MBS4223364.1 ABC transporter permease [Lederbergia citrea]